MNKKHILLEDEYIMVINKPCGLMVEPDRNNHPNLLQHVKKYLAASSATNQEVYAQHIHRLDRPVSGVILFTKQRSVLKNLSEQFAERRVRKYYQAITEHCPAKREGILEHWHQKLKKKAVITNEPGEYREKVLLNYTVSEHSAGRFLWHIELHTGKFHQIRSQLAAVGCPIVGDAFYGSPIHYGENAIALHAYKLIFHHPITDQETVVEAHAEFTKV